MLVLLVLFVSAVIADPCVENKGSCINVGPKDSGCAGTWKRGLCPGATRCCIRSVNAPKPVLDVPTAPRVDSPLDSPSTPSAPAGSLSREAQIAAANNRPVGLGSSYAYSNVKIQEKLVAMTWDDGPNPILTPKLLDIMKERNVKCTFFVLGGLAKQNPNIIRRMIAEGHEVADHTWNHPVISKLQQSEFDHQLLDTARVIQDITGKWPRLMRPPYGATTPVLNKMIRAAYNMQVIIWNVDPEDWKKPGSAEVTRRLVVGARPGAIMLAHDIHADSVAAAPAMFDQLLAQGFKFVTVSQLLSIAKIEDEIGKEHPGLAGDKALNDGGAEGTGIGGKNVVRNEGNNWGY